MTVQQYYSQGKLDSLAPNSPARHSIRNTLFFVGILSGFFPYIAVNLGHSSSIQLSQISLILAGLLGIQHRRSRALFVLLILLAPVLMSLLVLNFQSNEIFSISTGLKSGLTFLFAAAAILGVEAVKNHYDLKTFLSAVYLGILINTIGSIVQYLQFKEGRFPFLTYYDANQSFRPFTPDLISQYLKSAPRPFGFFPEPSAMNACVGAALVLVVIIHNYLIRTGNPYPYRFAFPMTLVCGGYLLVVSQSGSSPISLIGLFLVLVTLGYSPRLTAQPAAIASQARKSRQSARRWVVFLLVMAILGLFELSSRFGTTGGTVLSSWTIRATSFVQGFDLWTSSLPHLFFGLGPGQAELLFQTNSVAIIQSWGWAHIVAIFSVLGTYIVATGLIGMSAVIWMLVRCVGNIHMAQAYKVEGHILMVVWVVAAGITTSYAWLTPMWIVLGFMLRWDEIFTFSSGDIYPDARY